MTGLLSVEEIAAVLGEHRVVVSGDGDRWYALCTCGHREPGTDTSTHPATVLVQAIDAARPAWEAEVEARALEAVADDETRDEMAAAWGRGAAWYTTGTKVADVVCDWLRETAARCREGSQG